MRKADAMATTKHQSNTKSRRIESCPECECECESLGRALGPALSAISACDFHFISLRDSWQLEQIKGISHPARNSPELLLSATSQDTPGPGPRPGPGPGPGPEPDSRERAGDASRHASMIRKCKQTEFGEGTVSVRDGRGVRRHCQK